MSTPPSEDPRRTHAVKASFQVAGRPGTIWKIIADPARFSAWMEGDVSFEPRVGGPFRAGFPNHGIAIGGEIRSVDPETRRLALTWGIESGPQAAEYPAGSSLVEIRIGPDGPCSRVELLHSGLPSEELARRPGTNGTRTCGLPSHIRADPDGTIRRVTGFR